MKYDKIIVAIVLIQIGLIPAEIFTQIMKYFHLTTVSALEAMSMLWVPTGSLILGLLAGFGIGSWAAIITYHSAKILGTDYFPFKSMLLAMTFQALVFTIYGVLGGNRHLLQDVSGNLVHTAAAAMAGLIGGLLLKKYVFEPPVN